MGTTAQKLQEILNSKSALKTAIAKFKSNIGDKLSDYAPVVSEMADRTVEFGNFAALYRVDSYTIPLPTSGSTTLKPWLFYYTRAGDVYIPDGWTATSQRTFSYMNSNGSDYCRIHLPNTITSFNSNNPWTSSSLVIPILEDGWQANFTISGINHNGITQEVLEDMIDALADLTGETGKELTLNSSAQYNLISAEKLASAAAKNWTVTY